MSDEVIITHNSHAEEITLVVRRLRKFVVCLDPVSIYINDHLVGKLKNGQEMFLKGKVNSTFILEVRTAAWHNYYTLHLHSDAVFEFGFGWHGSGKIFRYNNVKPYRCFGCDLLNTELQPTQLQKSYTRLSMIMISICMTAYVLIQLWQCHIRIRF